MDVTSLNIFQWCKWMKHLGRGIMILIVTAIVALAAYSTIATALIPGITSSSNSTTLHILYTILLVIYVPLVCMVIWCYLATMATNPGGTPPGWHPFDLNSMMMPTSVDQQDVGVLPTGIDFCDPVVAPHIAQLCGNNEYLRALAGGMGAEPEDRAMAVVERPRWCKKCLAWKPPRSHHCSMTKRCVLKMDHYCVWVANTVGLLNYKQFVLFLGWTLLACLMSMGLLIKPCIRFFQGIVDPSNSLIVAFISLVFTGAFSVALIGFLVMHVRLVALNQTTIEAYEKSPITPWPWDRGLAGNFADVFDPCANRYSANRWRWVVPLWLIPVVTLEEKRRLLGEYLDIAVPLPNGWYDGVVLNQVGVTSMNTTEGGRSGSAIGMVVIEREITVGSEEEELMMEEGMVHSSRNGIVR